MNDLSFGGYFAKHSRLLFTPPKSTFPLLFPQQVFEQIAANAPLIDKEGNVPTEAFEWMHNAGMLQVTLPDQPLDNAGNHTPALLHLLLQTGMANLAVGRIYEGHINALLLAHLYATEKQKETWYEDVRQGKLFGVWNTQDAEGIKIHDTGDGQYRLEGCKTFCSGAGLVQRPLITGELISPHKKGWQMCIIPVEQVAEIPIDKSFWRPLGMRASASYRLNFSGVLLQEKDLLGQPDAYYSQPYFSGGAIRFAAVQAGGAKAIFRETFAYLKSLGRTSDPFQKARLAEIAWLVESAEQWLQAAGQKGDEWKAQRGTADKVVAYANMTRTAIEEICLRTMQLAERCVGARGLLQPGPIERIHRDLTLYLRQPAPDASLTGIADYAFTQNEIDELWK